MAPGVYRAVFIGLGLAGIAAAGLAVLALVPSAAGVAARPARLVGAAGLLSLAFIGLWIAGLRLRDHVERLDRLRGEILVAAAHDAPLPARGQGSAPDELGRLAQTVAQVVGQQRLRHVDPDVRLAAVVGAAADGLVVATETGLVSLVNAAAHARLGEDRLGVGTSIYDVFHRSELAEAVSQARAAGRAVTARLATTGGTAIELRVADLGAAGGMVISIPRTAEHAVGVRHDLGRHERPPPAAPITPRMPLAELPVVVLDTETTGLDVATDRIVSIGALRLHGRRIFRHLTLDRLVNPEQPIPARSTAIHGISTAMVAGAPRTAEVLPAVHGFLSGCVVVGHCIGFDLKILGEEAKRAGIAWTSPPALCTMRLAGGLFSDNDELSLEALAERLGVGVQGRHTALGDALVTAEVYVRLLTLLEDAGITRYGDALALADRPRKIIARQREAGWDV